MAAPLMLTTLGSAFIEVDKAPPDDGVPDLTGYAWYWDVAIAQPPYPNKYPTFVTKRAANAPYEGDNRNPDTVGLNTVGRIYSGSLATAGGDRRIVTFPVIDCAAFDGLGGSGTIRVQSLACVLLLHPIKKGAGPNSTKMWVEYVADASLPLSPCTILRVLPGVSADHWFRCSCNEYCHEKKTKRRSTRRIRIGSAVAADHVLHCDRVQSRALYQYNTLTKSVRDAARYLSVQSPGSGITQSKNLIVYGNLGGTGSPLAIGLSTSQVPDPVWAFSGALPVINTVTVKITGYTFRPLFGSVFGLNFGNITYADITATMRAPL